MVLYSSTLLDLDLPIRYPAVIVITGISTTDKALRVNKFLFNFKFFIWYLFSKYLVVNLSFFSIALFTLVVILSIASFFLLRYEELASPTVLLDTCLIISSLK